MGQEKSGSTETATYALGPARDFFLRASRDYAVATKQVGETRQQLRPARAGEGTECGNGSGAAR